jgi:outer membrane protein
MRAKVILIFVLLLVWTAPAIPKEHDSVLLEKPQKNPSSSDNVPGGKLITLGQGLRLVTKENRAVKIAQGNEAISDADVLKARSPFFPSVNGSLSNTTLAYEPTGIFSTPQGTLAVPTSQREFYAYSLVVQQTLFDFWGNYSRYASSKAIFETKKLDTQRVRNQVAFNFALAYFDLLEAEKLVTVAQEEVERLEAHLRDSRNLYQAGVITRNDVLQAEVRLADGRQKLIAARNEEAIKTSRLNNLLLWPLQTKTRIVEEKREFLRPLGFNLETAWGRALQERPEILIADGTLKSLRLDEVAKKSDYYPKIFARGGYDYAQNRYQLHEGNWSVIVGMDVNLFSGLSTRADVSKIRSQQHQLLEQRAKLEDDIRLEVQQYMLDLENNRDRIRVTGAAIAQAKENLRINEARYEEGVGTATEVLDAVTLLTVTETNYHRAVYDFSRSEAGVYYSMGVDLAEVYR